MTLPGEHAVDVTLGRDPAIISGLEKRIEALERHSRPDYDSDWVADNNTTTHNTTLTHNLRLTGPPLDLKIWFSATNTPSLVSPTDNNAILPVTFSGMSVQTDLTTAVGYRNPSGIRIFTNTLIYSMYNNIFMWSYYDGTWHTWSSGYYRWQIWV